ncbi:glycosyltransferase family 4 protein [Zafaria sp. Z1313]|uniref:glycosyltransferase family 4 protein n=1 Tax=Zafaria sp. Z1313 TaxID=3423202 RepID=UPI003D3024AF
MTHSYDPESTPPQRRWSGFIRAFRRHGWDVDVVVPMPHPDRCARGAADNGGLVAWRRAPGRYGESVRRVPLLRHRESRASKLLSNVAGALVMVPAGLAGPRPDLVVVTIPALPTILAGFLVSRLRRRPLVVEMRDAWPDLAVESGAAPGAVTGAFHAVLTWFQRRAAVVVTVTDGFGDVLAGRGIQAVSIPNGVRPSSLPHVPAHEFGPGPLKVLYLGNHGESQGLDRIVRAAALAEGSVQVKFVGEGTEKQSLRALAERLDAPVEFLEPVPAGAVGACYAWADTCVVSLRPDWPSFKWTIPSKTYELIATGRHLTCVVQGEAESVLRAAGVGDFVDPDPAAIAALWRGLLDEPERLRVSADGRGWVARHADIELIAGLYIRVLEQVVAGKNVVRRQG